MYEGKSVTKCLFEAFEFVMDHLQECYLLAAPVILFTIVTTALSLLAMWNLSSIIASSTFNYLILGLQPFVIAMFAVSWHRFTALPAERNVTGLTFRLGKRELFFGLFSVAIWVAGTGLTFLTAFISTPIAAILILILLIPLLLIMFFVYPAIALDQRLEFGFFFEAGTKRIFSFLLALGVALLFSIVWSLVIAIVSWLIADVFSPMLLFVLLGILNGLVLTPIATAIAVSTATILYTDVFGFNTSGSGVAGMPAE